MFHTPVATLILLEVTDHILNVPVQVLRHTISFVGRLFIIIFDWIYRRCLLWRGRTSTLNNGISQQLALYNIVVYITQNSRFHATLSSRVLRLSFALSWRFFATLYLLTAGFGNFNFRYGTIRHTY